MLSSIPVKMGVCGNGRDAKYAPIGGPMQKQIEKAIPINASDRVRRSGGVMSERMALKVIESD